MSRYSRRKLHPSCAMIILLLKLTNAKLTKDGYSREYKLKRTNANFKLNLHWITEAE